MATKLDPTAQIIVVPEVRGILLGYSVSLISGLPLIVLRHYPQNSLGPNPLIVTTNSLPAGEAKTYAIGAREAEAIKGKRLTFIDDQIDTGSTLESTINLLDQRNATCIQVLVIATIGRRSYPIQPDTLINLTYIRC